MRDLGFGFCDPLFILGAVNDFSGASSAPVENALDSLAGNLPRKSEEAVEVFGAVTKRPRRTGWYDAVIARYAQQVNGVDCYCFSVFDVKDETSLVVGSVAVTADFSKVFAADKGKKDYKEVDLNANTSKLWCETKTPVFVK